MTPKVSEMSFREPESLIQSVAQAGAVRSTIYPLKPNRRGWAGIAAFWLVLPVTVLVISLAASVHGALDPFFIMLGIATLGVLYPVLALVRTRIRICEHGLIVDSVPGRSRRFLIPYLTIDSGSVMVHPTPSRGGAYRYKPLTAATKRYPWPGLDRFVLAACPLRPKISLGPPYGQPLNIWGAPYSRHGISFRALHPVFASPWWRARPAVRDHPPRAQWVLGTLRMLLDRPELRPVLVFNDQPVMRWMFGTDRPEDLLREIETAMVASGVAEAAGFAAHAMANPYDRPPRDIPDDPQLW
ncbi:hypothetical protein [Actinoallomurus bryophytorum]|nr:hypothetical protein [Actinoallomurus bryophytorum]